jgi:signal transduction histidine kinase
LVVPLMANEEALGVMMLFSPRPNAFDEEQLRLVTAAGNQVGAAINNAELYRLIRDQAERLGGMLRGQQVEATKSRAILEGIADGVLVADATGAVILFNVACERILGLQRQQVVGRPLAEFIGIYGSAGGAGAEAVERWGRDPGSYAPGDFVDQRLTLDNQKVISVHLAPVVANEEYLGSVSVIRDITREVEVDRLKSEFVTNVSHELRTPMTSIKGYADLLLMGAAGPLQNDQARFLEVIKGNADRLSLLVNDLLDISRIESGRVQLTLRSTSIADVMQDVLATLQGRIEDDQKPMELVAEAEPGLPHVRADRERVTQVLMNLADNAFNYSHAGGRITLRARGAAGGHEVVVEVTDTGIGVAPEDQARLFDRFYRGEDALVLATAGTGLGLAIARQLIEMHGGRLWLAHSEPGRGSTFALALPVAGPR